MHLYSIAKSTTILRFLRHILLPFLHLSIHFTSCLCRIIYVGWKSFWKHFFFCGHKIKTPLFIASYAMFLAKQKIIVTMFEVSSILEKLPQNILLFHYPLPSKMGNNLLMSFLTQRSIDENEIDALLHPNAVYRFCNMRTTFRTLSSYGK